MRRPTRSLAIRVGFAATAGAALTRPAEAHLVTTGLGPYYDGATHLLQSADDLLAVLCLALLAGLNGKEVSRRTLFLLTGVWWLSGLAAHALRGPALPGWVAPLSLVATGLLAALDRRLNAPAMAALAALVGAIHGWGNGAALALDGREARGLFGTVLAIFVLVALVAATTSAIERPGLRIAARVGGSWGAAIGLLLLGWALRGG